MTMAETSLINARIDMSKNIHAMTEDALTGKPAEGIEIMSELHSLSEMNEGRALGILDEFVMEPGEVIHRNELMGLIRRSSINAHVIGDNYLQAKMTAFALILAAYPQARFFTIA